MINDIIRAKCIYTAKWDLIADIANITYSRRRGKLCKKKSDTISWPVLPKWRITVNKKNLQTEVIKRKRNSFWQTSVALECGGLWPNVSTWMWDGSKPKTTPTTFLLLLYCWHLKKTSSNLTCQRSWPLWCQSWCCNVHRSAACSHRPLIAKCAPARMWHLVMCCLASVTLGCDWHRTTTSVMTTSCCHLQADGQMCKTSNVDY